MSPRARLKRSALLVIWRVMNPLARALAGIAPWWVVIETTGRRTGAPRRTPLARGPIDESTAWLISVHGRHAAWVRNLEANPAVRLRVRRRWRTGTAAVAPYDPAVARRFNPYARLGPRALGIDPALVRVDLQP